MATRIEERRTWEGSIERRADRGDRAVVGGYAIVWDRRSQNLGGFVEVTRRGSTTKTLQEADIRALKNHDPNLVVGRNRGHNPTLVLREDEIGLDYEVLIPDTTTGRDLLVEVEGGLITGSSFGFRTIRDSWGETAEGFPERALDEIALRDVGPVTFPAYPDATAGRRALEAAAETRSLDISALVAASKRGDLLTILSPADSSATASEQSSDPAGSPAADGTDRRSVTVGRLRPPGLV